MKLKLNHSHINIPQTEISDRSQISVWGMLMWLWFNFIDVDNVFQTGVVVGRSAHATQGESVGGDIIWKTIYLTRP